MRGRKPIPEAIKAVIRGRACDRGQAMKEPPPDCPPGLSQAAKTEWSRVVDTLSGRGTIGSLDMAVLAVYCQAWADWLDVSRRIKKAGLTGKLHTTKRGRVMMTGMISLQRNYFDQMMKAAAELGLSPVSRARVKRTGGPPKDSLSEFIQTGLKLRRRA